MRKLQDILNSSQASLVLPRNDLITIKRAVETIGDQAKRTKKKKRGYKIWATNSERRQVKDAINCLLRVAINEPVVPILKNLVNEFVKVVLDWNENFGKEQEIKENVLTLKRFINYYFSAVEAIQVLKTLSKRVKKIQKFSPPAFELSQAYLKTLQKGQTGKIKDNLKR